MSPKLKTELGQLPPNELVELVQWAVLRLRDVEALELLFKEPSTKQEKIDQQWFEEGDRRAEAVANGKMKLISSIEANKRIKATLERLQNHV